MTFQKYCDDLCKLGNVLAIDAGLAFRLFCADIAERRSSTPPTGRGSVSLIPIFGVLTQYGDYGTTSMTDIGAQFDTAMRNSAIGSIVLAIDSPGGVIQGTPELAKKIYASRGLGKQIVAVAAPDAASARNLDWHRSREAIHPAERFGRQYRSVDDASRLVRC